MPLLMCFLWTAQKVVFSPSKAHHETHPEFALSLSPDLKEKYCFFKEINCLSLLLLMVVLFIYRLLKTDGTLDTAVKHSKQTVSVCQKTQVDQHLQLMHGVQFANTQQFKNTTSTVSKPRLSVNAELHSIQILVI